MGSSSLRSMSSAIVAVSIVRVVICYHRAQWLELLIRGGDARVSNALLIYIATSEHNISGGTCATSRPSPLKRLLFSSFSGLSVQAFSSSQYRKRVACAGRRIALPGLGQQVGNLAGAALML
ncbi:hypothetical protein NDU88_004088 [Pleurodeles waltl]|uniref:Secreted protein n=1 Tax=Pleurodeles waltl TaxID=8319 RepID=A0AAV7V1V6_PLEWA|nr:hypothetical protein NDU88_004088 [Pleurodeles waltl]